MDRRRFLYTGAAASAVALSGVPLAYGTPVEPPASRVRLLRLDSDLQRFLPHRSPWLFDTVSTPLRLRLDGMLPAAHGGLDELRLVALFPSATPWRFEAWRYRRDDPTRTSRSSSFLLPRQGLHGLAVDWREGADWRHEMLGFGPGAALVPGHYVLTTAPVGSWNGLVCSGDPRRPLAGPRSFDALAFTVEPDPPGIEEPLRADLACLQAEASGCS